MQCKAEHFARTQICIVCWWVFLKTKSLVCQVRNIPVTQVGQEHTVWLSAYFDICLGSKIAFIYPYLAGSAGCWEEWVKSERCRRARPCRWQQNSTEDRAPSPRRSSILDSASARQLNPSARFKGEGSEFRYSNHVRRSHAGVQHFAFRHGREERGEKKKKALEEIEPWRGKKKATNTECILIVYCKVLSSQCVCVNTGEGTQIRAFPRRGS